MKLFYVVILFSFWPSQAQAYFDPGTGSLLIQIVVGGVATLAVFWNRLKNKIASWFRRNSPEDNKPDEK